MTELAALSDVPSELCLLSPRSLSILNDLAREDVHELARYAVVKTLGGYVPVGPESDDSELVDDYAEAVELELIPMTLPISLATFVNGTAYLQPFIPGCESVQCEVVNYTSIAGGSIVIYNTAVPSGHLDVVEWIAAMFSGTATNKRMQTFAVVGASTVLLDDITPAVTQSYRFVHGPITLPAAAKIGLYISGMNAGDSLTLQTHARRVSLTAV